MKQLKPAIDQYTLYNQFLRQWLPVGFREIDRSDTLILKLEKFTEKHDQFFLISDHIQLKIIFSSRRSIDILGVAPMEMDPSVFINSIHPDDQARYSRACIQLINIAQQLFIAKKGRTLVSSNFRFKNASGEFRNTLLQSFLFFTEMPYKTVFILQVATDISWFRKFKFGYHCYHGNDLTFFRLPDERLLLMGDTDTPGDLRSLN